MKKDRVKAMIFVFCIVVAGINTGLSENLNMTQTSTISFVFDGSSGEITNLIYKVSERFNGKIPIDFSSISSIKDLNNFHKTSYVAVFVFHGSLEGIYINHQLLSWKHFAEYLDDLPSDNIIVESCYSSKLLPFLKSPEKLLNIHTLSNQIDIKLADYDMSLAIANFLLERDYASDRNLASTIYQDVIFDTTKNVWEYMMLSLFPEDPLGINIPDTSGLNGPVGFFVDLIFKFLRDYGIDSIDTGFSFSNSISLTGENSLLPKQVDLALTFSWSLEYDGETISINANFELPADQPEDSRLAALLKVGGFSIGVEGEFGVSLIASTISINNQTVVAFQLRDFTFSFTIGLEREIALIEFLIGGVPAASAAPYPFDEILRAISVKITFSVSLTITLDLVLQVHIFNVDIGFGVELHMGIDLGVISAEVGVGSEITFGFSFSSIGNIFSVLVTVYWYISASMAFWTGEYKQEASWEYSAGDGTNPSRTDGKQMNIDSDYDGLSDAYEEKIGTDPLINDTDDDGALDGYEVFNLLTDPIDDDTDGDDIKDGDEEQYWLSQGLMANVDSDSDGIINILDPDSDNDGILDGEEKAVGTSPILKDTDGDHIDDLMEIQGYQITVKINGISEQRTVYTSPLVADTDGDGLEDYVEQNYFTDPTLKDTDGDGLEDLIELGQGWSPIDDDTDGDGIKDGDEVNYGLDPSLNDSDGDGWLDYDEVTYNSNHGGITQDTDGDGIINILDPDSDNDYILDGEEINGWQTTSYTSNPLVVDTDNDSLNDTMEYQLNCNPNDNDTDGDNLYDGEEYLGIVVTYNESWVQNGKVYTDPTKNDTDDDGRSDYSEIYGSPVSDPNDDDSDDDYLPDSYDPAPSDPDADDDGWLDGPEYAYWNETRGLGDNTATSNIQDADVDNDGLEDWAEYTDYHTDPNNSDTDGDSLSDYQETQGFGTILNGTAVTIKTDPLNVDTDGDGLNDNYEAITIYTDPRIADSDDDWLSDQKEVQVYNTDPWVADTDGDKLTDYQEVCYNTNPLSNDTDMDSLTDYQEIFGVVLELVNSYNMVHYYIKVYCDPHNPDTDLDGIPDGVEVFNFGTNPQLKDSDFDGLNDSVEINFYHTSPLDPDSDDDLVNDYTEIFGYQYTGLCIPHPGELTLVGVGKLRLSPKFSPPADIFYDELSNRNDTTRIDYEQGAFQALILQFWQRSDALQLRLNQTSQGWVTNPLNPDTDNDNVIDGYEYVIGCNPRDNDTDDDFLTDGSELDFLGGYGTDPLNPDTDDDRLTDYQEIYGTLEMENTTYVFNPTNPLHNDTDTDGIGDYIEIVCYNTNPTNNDTDYDNLTDYQELRNFHTNPNSNDTDSDTLSDYAEIEVYGTSPTNNDTDGDGFTDDYELSHPPLSPLNPDYDNDGIPDGMEGIYNLNWNNSDENNNGILDGKEHDYDNDGLTDWQEFYETHSSLTIIDTDNDQLNDSFEAQLWYSLGFSPSSDLDKDGSTNLWDPDSDGDGITDYNETYIIGTNPGLLDTDSDLLNDYDEILYSCNGTNPDTDGDGSFDGLEVWYYGSNPTLADENTNSILDGRERDYDNDTLSDYDELYIYNTSQILLDSDRDNVPDNIEIGANTNPNDSDDYPVISIVSINYPDYVSSSEKITISIAFSQTVPISNATLFWYYDNDISSINQLTLTIKDDMAEGIIVPSIEWHFIHFWIEITDVFGHTVSSNNCTISSVSIDEFSTNYEVAEFMLIFGIALIILAKYYRKRKSLKLK